MLEIGLANTPHFGPHRIRGEGLGLAPFHPGALGTADGTTDVNFGTAVGAHVVIAAVAVASGIITTASPV